jgi:hypothetical protein
MTEFVQHTVKEAVDKPKEELRTLEEIKAASPGNYITDRHDRLSIT